jgi:hypothetical protein
LVALLQISNLLLSPQTKGVGLHTARPPCDRASRPDWFFWSLKTLEFISKITLVVARHASPLQKNRILKWLLVSGGIAFIF